MRSEFYEHVIISSVAIAVVNYLVVVVANDCDHEAITFELHAKQKPALAGMCKCQSSKQIPAAQPIAKQQINAMDSVNIVSSSNYTDERPGVNRGQ